MTSLEKSDEASRCSVVVMLRSIDSSKYSRTLSFVTIMFLSGMRVLRGFVSSSFLTKFFFFV